MLNLETDKTFEVLNFDATPEGETPKYQNRHKRAKMLANSEPTVKRCHSFDFTSARVHSRKVPSTSIERAEILRHYNEAMGGKKKHERCPMVQSEIRHKCSIQDKSNVVDLKIELTPSAPSFEGETEFDEVIYLSVSGSIFNQSQLKNLLSLRSCILVPKFRSLFEPQSSQTKFFKFLVHEVKSKTNLY